jgi:folate-binding protein YgfZ
MQAELQAALSGLGARFTAEAQGPADFGDAAAERAAVRDESYVADLSHRALLSFEGADARDFLHGQLTCDVAGLPEDLATYGGYCTAKGRLLATFLLWRQGEAWRMLLPQSIAAAIQKRLKMYVLRAKVRIDLLPDIALLGLGGPEAAGAARAAGLDLPTDPLQVRVREAGTAVALPGGRWLVCLPVPQAVAAWKALVALHQPAGAALKPVGAPAWDWTEIRNGIPSVDVHTQEQFVPQMANLERIGGVSFKKGCYPGQEIVARTQYLGKVKRRMVLAHSAAAAQSGDELFSDDVAGQANGMVVNASAAPDGGFDLLGVVQSASAEQSRVHLRAPDGPVLDIQALPYSAE